MEKRKVAATARKQHPEQGRRTMEEAVWKRGQQARNGPKEVTLAQNEQEKSWNGCQEKAQLPPTQQELQQTQQQKKDPGQEELRQPRQAWEGQQTQPLIPSEQQQPQGQRSRLQQPPI